jgi:MFS family permease
VPLTVGFLVSGPLSGWLSDHLGARPFATLGMVLSAAAFLGIEALPVDFSYVWFALLLFALGAAMGLFASPNRAQVMNSLPPHQRGVGGGMSTTFQNSAMVLSIGVFFSLMVLGLAAGLPSHLEHGLLAAGLPRAKATEVAHLPPVGTLFAAFLGYNPVGVLLGSSIHHLSRAHALQVTGRGFFPSLIATPFEAGLRKAFDFAAIACLVAALASWLSGGTYVHEAPREAVVEAAGSPLVPLEESPSEDEDAVALAAGSNGHGRVPASTGGSREARP